jgi:hypothetical protein
MYLKEEYMRRSLLQISKRLNALAATLLLLVIQAYAPFSFMIPVANAAPQCTVDTAGPNDEPGQKDLNKLCVDYAGLPTTVSTTWNWDETGTSGANTMDACNLFDTDNDGYINYAVCVTTQGDPATLQTTTTYSCGDAKIDRCTTPATPISSGATSCSVSQVTNDPFPGPSAQTKGDDYPNDTQGSCTVQLSTIGGTSAKLIDVCSYPSEQPNSDPSDCVIIRDSAGKVELIKDLIPGTDTGLFNLSINGPEASDTTTVNNVGDGGTTGEVVVKDGTVIVSETPGTNTSLTTYTTTIVCRDLNGTGAIVGQGSPTGASSRQLSFTLADQADVVCTITNTRANGTITLIKNVINDNGGTATANSFGLTTGGTPVTSGQVLSLAPGSYAINEAGLAGYQFVSITGTGCPTQLGGNVVLASNQNITCTITNDDVAGQMRVIKNVVNDDGGNAVASDFTLSVNAVARTQNQYFSANAGSYTVTETGPSGYTMTGIACVDDTTQQTVSHPVNLVVGQSVTCTVTNNDNAPGLTVVKQVINNDGGTATADDFVMRVNGNSLSSPTMSNGNLTASYAVPNVQSNTSYAVSEDAFSGYAGTTVSCVDNSTQLTVSHPVTLNEGQSVTCSITNNDVAPKITVVKTVINNDGGTLQVSDFPLFVGTVQVTSGVENEFDAGLYVVSETNQPGYIASTWGGDCAINGSITLQVGGVYTCSITNNDQPATIIVTKQVTNNNGGNAVVNDFTLKVNTTTVVSGATNTFPANVSYTISETNVPSGYTQTSLVCNDITGQAPVPVSNPFTAQLGHTYSCLIVNDDVAPTLTVVKKVINDNGGSATVSSFDLEINDNDLTFGGGVVNGNETTYTSTNNPNANTNYTLSEIDFVGYTEGTWSCTDGTQGTGLTVIVNLNEGENVTCTITNNDIAPALYITKHVLNDDGGDVYADEFQLYVNDISPSGPYKGGGDIEDNSVTYQFDDPVAGVLYTVTEDEKEGYQQVSIVCIDNDTDQILSHPVTLSVGQSVTCTVTNSDIAPKLTLIKNVTNNNGGEATASDWTLTANPVLGDEISGNGADGVDEEEAVANLEYFLSESLVDGYDVSIDWSCDGGTFDAEDNSITLNEGDDVTCEITNDDIAPKLTIVKQTNSDGGDQAFSFSGDLGEFSLMDGESESDDTLSADTYEVTEINPTGWKLNDIYCSGTENWYQTGNTLSVSLDLADDVTCTFYNDKLGEINGSKFEDMDGDSNEWEEGESGLGGWTIQLIRTCEYTDNLSLSFLDNIVIDICEETVVDETVTAEDGSYSFKKVDFGTYKVCEVQQVGWTQTYPNNYEDMCYHVNIHRSGQVKDDKDFGNFEHGDVTGFKFNDSNNNGVYDTGEEKLSGWSITLTKHCAVEPGIILYLQTESENEEECEDETISTVTDQNGNYSFGDLKMGDYTVCEVQQTGWFRTYPANSDCHEFSIESSGQNVSANFGNKAVEKGRVLGELVNTGTPITQNMVIGLVILVSVVGITVLSRKKTISSRS